MRLLRWIKRRAANCSDDAPNSRLIGIPLLGISSLSASRRAMKAILTFSRGWNALAAARSLGRRGVQIVAGDEYRFSPTSFSKYTIDHFLYPNPDENPAGFLDKLEEVVRKHRDEDTEGGEEYVLMPFHKESFLIAAHRERFE